MMLNKKKIPLSPLINKGDLTLGNWVHFDFMLTLDVDLWMFSM